MDSLSLSPLALFQHAGWIGKAVMLTLGGLSVYCWVLIVEIAWSRVRLGRAIAAAAARAQGWPPLLSGVAEAGARAAATPLAGESTGEVRNRIEDAMERAGRSLLQPAINSLNGLAIIASAAPFIGLFGTVWGIVTAFSSIAQARDTSLAVVAPGIAEALAATAFGLLAAIPASIAYNRLSAAINAVSAALSDVGAEHAVQLLAARPATTGGQP